MHDTAAHTIPGPGADIGPYLVVGELGRGGMASVLEVVHRDGGEHRALKLMLPTSRSGEAARRMEREFVTLSRLDHPAVLRVFDAGLYQGRPWFVTEKLVGQDLRDAVEGWRSVPPAERYRRAQHVLVEVAGALAYIHDQGLVHRDVTPGNIMLLRDGSVRLMDFGVVKEPGAELTQAGEVVGTVAYIAPEQITGGVIDARTDLYALGAVLYKMLTGRRPFNARNLAGYLDKHLNRPPRPPHELAPTLPARLDEICLRLLAKDPDDRFASARHLLLALQDEPLLPGLATASIDISTLPVTGRSHELAAMRDAVTRLIEPLGGFRAEEMTGPTDEGRAPPRPPGGVLILEGSDGMGTSRLATELRAMAAQVDVSVTRVRGTGDTRPWSGFRKVIEGLRELPGFTLPAAVDQALAQQRGRDRWAVAAAARDLVAAFGPRVIIVEDAHRVDRASLDLLAYLVRNLVQGDRFPLLVLLTSDSTVPGGSLDEFCSRDLGDVQPTRLHLSPLSVAAVEELLLHLVVDGPAARALAARLARDGEGNPFFVMQMLRGLVEEGVIARGDATRRGRVLLTADELARATLPVPATIRQALQSRLARLQASSLHLLELLAVAREPLLMPVLALASDRTGDEGLDVEVVGLVEAGLLTLGEAGAARVALARHRLADVLVEGMNDLHARELHARLARALERHHRTEPQRAVAALAEHFAAAGRPAVAWPYLLMAANLQQDRGEIGDALRLVERGLDMEPRARAYTPLAEADRRLAEGLRLRTTSLVHLGRWEEAATEATRALEVAEALGEDLAVARAATEVGALHRRRHDLDQAEIWLTRALAHADAGGAIALRQARVIPLYELGAVHWARGDLDEARRFWVETVSAAEALQDEKSQAIAANGLGVLALCRGEAAEARRHFERAIEVSKRHGMAERLVVSRINLIELHHMTGNLRKGTELADRTVAEAREVGIAYGIALGLRYRALVLADLGRFADAAENAQTAATMQEALGNPEELLSARVMSARVALYRADLDAADAALDAIEPLLADHDTEGFGPVVHAWRARILAARGQPELARAAVARAEAAPGRRWPHQRIRVLLNVGRAHEVLGEADRAADLADEALRLADASGYRLYAMRARQVAARTVADEATRARHQRVADALARSLAANLPRDDAASFMARQPRLEQPAS